MKMRRWIIAEKEVKNNEVLLHPDAVPLEIHRFSRIVDADKGLATAVTNLIFVVPKDLEDVEVKA